MYLTKSRKKVAVFVVIFTTLVISVILSPKTAKATGYGSSENNFRMTDRQVAFLEKWWPAVVKACEKYRTKKLSDSDYAMMAQLGLESGHGTSDIFLDKNNGLGIDAYPTETESVYEHARYFNSVEDCLEEHSRFITERYKKCLQPL